MIDYTGYYGILAESDNGITQIIFFVIIMAMGLIGNITKAAKAKKRSGHTGKNRSERKPLGQRLSAQKSVQKPNPGKKRETAKYYAPGGFAEVLQDEALEETLKTRSKRVSKFNLGEGQPQPQAIKDIESTEVMRHELESMGHLESLDPETSFEENNAAEIVLSLNTSEDLAKAVLYAEIIGKPVALRGS
jgi:hypothetical protein